MACERYRGFIEISYKQSIKVPVAKGRSSRVGPIKRFTIEMQTILLCQLLITLPKKAIEVDENAALMSFHFDPNGNEKVPLLLFGNDVSENVARL